MEILYKSGLRGVKRETLNCDLLYNAHIVFNLRGSGISPVLLKSNHQGIWFHSTQA